MLLHTTICIYMVYFILVSKGLLHETAPFLIRLMIEKEALMLLKVCQHFVHQSCAEKLHPRSSLETSLTVTQWTRHRWSAGGRTAIFWWASQYCTFAEMQSRHWFINSSIHRLLLFQIFAQGKCPLCRRSFTELSIPLDEKWLLATSPEDWLQRGIGHSNEHAHGFFRSSCTILGHVERCWDGWDI